MSLIGQILLSLSGYFPSQQYQPPHTPHTVPYIKDAETGVTILEPVVGDANGSYIKTDRLTRESTLFVLDQAGKVVEQRPYRRFVAPKIS